MGCSGTQSRLTYHSSNYGSGFVWSSLACLMKVSCEPEINLFPPSSEARAETASKWPSSVSRLSILLRSMISMPADDVAAARKLPITTMPRTGKRWRFDKTDSYGCVLFRNQHVFVFVVVVVLDKTKTYAPLTKKNEMCYFILFRFAGRGGVS